MSVCLSVTGELRMLTLDLGGLPVELNLGMHNNHYNKQLANIEIINTEFNALFQKIPTAQQTFPTIQEQEIELPNFDKLFGRIQQVSPLAPVAVEGGGSESNGASSR